MNIGLYYGANHRIGAIRHLNQQSLWNPQTF